MFKLIIAANFKKIIIVNNMQIFKNYYLMGLNLILDCMRQVEKTEIISL